MKPSGVFYGSCETVKPCHGLQSNKTSSVCVCVCVCASYVGSNAFLSFKFDYFGEHFSISPTIMALNTFLCTEIRLRANTSSTYMCETQQTVLFEAQWMCWRLYMMIRCHVTEI